MMHIPLVNLGRQYTHLRDEINGAIQRVIDSRSFIQGPFVEAFEREFAQFCDCRFAVGCANGTAAITLALHAAGVNSGDEVITVAHTFAATANAIRAVGAIPRFVDIEPDSYCVDVDRLTEVISARTKAIVPVHIYGTPCNMTELTEIANARGVTVIEDAAQAHGASFDGRPVGSFGKAATFSFYPGKNLGAYGDAGAVITNDVGIAARVRKLRDHGRSGKYLHDIVGFNQRMDGIQGAILSVKLAHLAAWNETRRSIAKRYDRALRKHGFKTVAPSNRSWAVYHLYVIECSNRGDVQRSLAAAGIDSGVHYPVPLHRQPSFEHGCAGLSLPVTERIADRIVSLPICPDLSEGEQEYVIDQFLSVARP
jgi:dTDP-4-amino-4,6-dideoxygalactose transaminase